MFRVISLCLVTFAVIPPSTELCFTQSAYSPLTFSSVPFPNLFWDSKSAEVTVKRGPLPGSSQWWILIPASKAANSPVSICTVVDTLCLEASVIDSTLSVSPRNQRKSQLWKLESNGIVRSQANNSLVVGIFDSQIRSGSQLVLTSSSDLSSQEWDFEAANTPDIRIC